MATNQYFRSNYNASVKDQRLLDNLITESIQVMGIDLLYLPRTFVNRDELFGEDQSSAFADSMPIEMYIKSVDGFGGDGHFLQNFGLEIRDEVTLSVSRTRFADQLTQSNIDIPRPREGDLIKMPEYVDARERIFEIAFVDEDALFYQLGELYTYDLRCHVFEYGGETFDTGDNTIDDYQTINAINAIVDMDSGSGDYIEGETVTQGPSKGEVVSWDSSASTLIITKVQGFDPIVAEPVTGQTSGAQWTPVPDSVSYTNEGAQSDNDFFEDQSFATFDPNNPFGE